MKTICAYCGGFELEHNDPNGGEKMASHVISCEKNPFVKQLKAVADAIQPVVDFWSDIKASTREPLTLWLKKPENEESLSKLVVELNQMQNAIDSLRNL